MYLPDGRPFLSFVEVQEQLERERQRAEAERQRAERLAARLRALGIDSDVDMSASYED